MDFDRGLIARAKAGDRSACETIVDQFAPMVFRLISRFFRTREDVEDLAQDVFLKLFARIDQVRPDENFPGWLARVTVNRTNPAGGTDAEKVQREPKRRENEST